MTPKEAIYFEKRWAEVRSERHQPEDCDEYCIHLHYPIPPTQPKEPKQ